MATETKDRLTTALYLLMRDSVHVGAITRVARYVEANDVLGDPAAENTDGITTWTLTNEPLAALAASLAERLR